MNPFRGKKYPKVRVVAHNKPPFVLAHPIFTFWVAVMIVALFLMATD